MKRSTLILVLLVFGLHGCEGTNPIGGTPVTEETVTTSIGETLILPQYIEFDKKTHKLVDYITTFFSDRSQQNLDSARLAWRDAHAAWCRTEAFIFGPAATENVEKTLDYSPIFPDDIRIKLVTTADFNTDKILTFDGPLKGFHTIEFLLWDSAGTKQPADFTSKEFAYMRSVAEDITLQSQQLYLEWDPSRGNYLRQLREAGGTSEYASHREVLRTMINSMINACSLLADRKIGGPLAYGAAHEESHFSGNSAIDYHNTLIGVRNVYLGGETEAGLSIATLLHAVNKPELDTRIREEFQDAMTKVSGLHPFAAKLATDRDAVLAAQAAVRKLEATLIRDVIPALGL